MLTFKPQNHSGRIAAFISNNARSNMIARDIYLTMDDDDNKVIPRGELVKYIDKSCFIPKGSRYPISERDIHVVVDAILHENPLGITHPHLRGIYETAHRNMLENMKHNFNADWENGRLYAVPTRREEQRDYIICSGPAGSGKTYWAADYAQAYDHTYKGKRPIYLITVKESCSKFDQLDYVKRVHQRDWKTFMNLEKLQRTTREKYNENKRKKYKKDKEEKEDKKEKEKDKDKDKEEDDDFDDNEDNILDLDTIKRKQDKKFAQSLFIFDDIDNVSEKYKSLINDFKEYITEVGRESEIDIIECNHMLMDGMKTRSALAECTAVVTFPSGITPYHLKRYLKEYLALSNDHITKILNDKSRWVMIGKFVPITVVTPNRAYVVKQGKEDDNDD